MFLLNPCLFLRVLDRFIRLNSLLRLVKPFRNLAKNFIKVVRVNTKVF
jgi:hypothetical protein